MLNEEGAPAGYGSPSGKRVRPENRREFESRAFRVDEPIDVDSILASLPDEEPGDNPWGTAFGSIDDIQQLLHRAAHESAKRVIERDREILRRLAK